ncbi:E3 SUMO-protein ligase ZBED1-like [Saccostrea echinata]|uniref:E3 SUMO-protein ligase ZBED1-like n=1 Tax=Saccostrea echinata TaxID=191078 RepID=UPI002A81F44D|nr:E3 SUMO-protein ligase ZBED1-like [Saccostrea echinata]
MDVRRRWNSAYDMISRFLEMQVAIFATLKSKELGKERESELKSFHDDDFSVAEEVIQLLKPFKDKTTLLCSEKSPTISIILPLHNKLLDKLCEQNADTPTVRSMKNIMFKDLKERFARIEHTLHIVSALDPRFKMLPFSSGNERSAVYSDIVLEVFRVQNIIKVKREKENKDAELDDVEVPSEPPLPSLSSLSDSPAVSSVKMRVKADVSSTSCGDCMESVLHSFLDDVYITEIEPPKSPNVIAEQQVNEYRSAQAIPLQENPLSWWKENEFKFPLVSKLARAYLCIPATSVPSERVFSTAGEILSAQRARLKPKHCKSLKESGKVGLKVNHEGSQNLMIFNT